MRDRRRLLSALSLMVAVAVTTVACAKTPRYDVGRPLTAADTLNGEPAIAPDGTGLPRGGGSVAQGATIYQRSCAGCHGGEGQGIGEYPALVGGQGTLATKSPVQTVGSFWPYATTVWDYINRAMPYTNAGSLSNRDVYAVTAYLLYLNHIVPADAELSETSLPRVRMPNRDGFVADPRPDLHSEADRRGFR
jgi:S-disulfanyl-L-cysteine oxidoreductase SoxD